MKGFHSKVNVLAGAKEKAEVSLVVNLFQSVLDGFIRREMKRVDSEPPKVNLHFFSPKCLMFFMHKSYLTFHIALIFFIPGYQDNKEEKEKGKMCKMMILSFLPMY